MGFVDPSTLTDAELIEDLDAARRISADILNSEYVPYSVKKEYSQHVESLIREQKSRDDQDWMYPLSSLGIVDFL